MPPPLSPHPSPRPIARRSRRWVVLFVTALLGLLLAIAGSIALPSTYTARSTVSVRAIILDEQSQLDTDQRVNLATEQQLARSTRVTEAAAMRLEPRYSVTSQEIQDDLVVSAPDQSSVLIIELTGADPARSAAAADAVAEAYLAERRHDASAEVDRLSASAAGRLAKLRTAGVAPAPLIDQRVDQIQADALANELARLGSIDTTPGQIVGATQEASRVGPGSFLLGIAGTMLGLLFGLLIVLRRTKLKNTTLGGADDITSVGDHLVLDGTQDTHRAETWMIATGLLRLPDDLGPESFVIVLDAEDDPRAEVTPGQELVDALARRGRAVQLVDTSRINEGKIYRGWPTVSNRSSWSGSIVVLDTTGLSSDALTIALATRADSVVLARSTNDDARALRRLTALMRHGNAPVELTVLFPPPR